MSHATDGCWPYLKRWTNQWLWKEHEGAWRNKVRKGGKMKTKRDRHIFGETMYLKLEYTPDILKLKILNVWPHSMIIQGSFHQTSGSCGIRSRGWNMIEGLIRNMFWKWNDYIWRFLPNLESCGIWSWSWNLVYEGLIWIKMELGIGVLNSTWIMGRKVKTVMPGKKHLDKNPIKSNFFK